LPKSLEKFRSNQKEYTVESLPYYVTKVDEIPSDTMDKIISHGESVFRSYVERKWPNPKILLTLNISAITFWLTKTLGGFLPILNCTWSTKFQQ